MFCKSGNSNTDQPNASFPVSPLFNLTQSDWFMHGVCRNYPPPSGEYLTIPANGQFTVEIAGNRAFTTLSYNGAKVTDWPDGKVHPNNWSTNVSDPMFPPSSVGCLGSPNIHTHGSPDAAGTAFAISYKNNINTVQLSDFAVFSILPNTPYKRVATYKVPNLPACPAGGCLCAWGWVPNHCGQSNMYLAAYKCTVTGAAKTALPVGAAQPPTWCESNPSTCVKGAKQLIAIWQQNGNNIPIPPGLQKDGQFPSPGYNTKNGFNPGAQTDIFMTSPVASVASAAVTAVLTDSPNSVSATATGTVVSLPGETSVVPSSARERIATHWLETVLLAVLYSYFA